MNQKYMWVLGGLLIVATGCAAPRIDTIATQGSLGAGMPRMDEVLREKKQKSSPVMAEPTGALKLNEALAIAVLKNPSLEAQAWEVRAAEARMLQAGLRPNPELALELEEYDRDGEGFDSSETVIVLGQAIELGNKRFKRKHVAEVEGRLAGLDYEARRLDVFTRTTENFIEVLGSQERVKLATTTVELARKTAKAVMERVKSGKEPPLQATKADADLEMAILASLEADKGQEIARRKLASCWGAEQVTFDTADGKLDYILSKLPDLENLLTRLSNNPDLARLEVELALQEATLAVEKAGRIPDLEFSVGVQSFEEDGTDALAFGIGVPLPIFDRNQGNNAAARYDLAKVKAEHKAAYIKLVTELTEKHAELILSNKKASVLKEKIVPARAKAFEAAHEGYKQGKFGFLDVLDAQRSMFEAQEELIDALVEYQIALAVIQRITATSIEELNK